MKSRRFELNHTTMRRHEAHPISTQSFGAPNHFQRTPLAYARSRVSNAAIHARAPLAAVRTRIGILSHPQPRDPSQWSSIRMQMKHILAEHGTRDAEAVTLLAGPVDRLFGMVAREQGMRLSLVIPCRNFQSLFGTPDEISEYVHLRTMAYSHIRLEHAKFTREAFDESLKFVVDTCDLVVAVGGEKTTTLRLGNENIISYSRERGKLLIWLNPEAPLLAPGISPIR